MSDHFAFDDDTALERLLAAKGARWRQSMDGRLPTGSAFATRMRQLLTEDDSTPAAHAVMETPEMTNTSPTARLWVAHNGHTANHDTNITSIVKGTEAMFRPDPTTIPSPQPNESMPMTPVTPQPPRRRFAGLAAGAAALVIVALFAATLTYTLHSRQTKTGSGTTPTASVAKTATPGATPTPNAPGVAPYDYRPLVIAPSDPQIVYNVLLNGAQPVRSSDGGATFHNITTPPTTLQGAQFTLMVSPLDANHLVAAAYSGACVAQGDPQRRAEAPGAPGAPASSSVAAGTTGACVQDYFSADGGQTWSALQLPFAGGIGEIDGLLRAPSLSYGEHAVFSAQGGRLYVAAAPASADGFILYAPGVRLLVSSDDGASWQFADNGLGANLSDFAAAPTGETVYATTSPGGATTSSSTTSTRMLWRSDNAGASWAQVNTLPASNDLGMIVAPDGALYINASQVVVAGGASSQQPQAALVSLDGGRSFTQAPTQGLPAAETLTGPMGLLSDGSIVMESSTGAYAAPAALYAWRVGASAWRRIGPQFSTMIVWAVIVAQHGADTVYVSDVNNVISHFMA